MMKIELLREGSKGLEDIYLTNGKFNRHHTGKSIKLMPFVTNNKKLTETIVDFRSFQGVVGECFRLSKNKIFDKNFKSDKETSFKNKLKEYIIKKALDKVDSDKKEEFENIIINLFFEEDADLIKFNKQVLPFMNFTIEHSQLNETARFFYDIFLDEDTLTSDDLISSENDNLFYKLIVDCLPELKAKKTNIKDVKYENLLSSIKKQFLIDFNFLASNEETFLKHVEDLFKYYYFFYLTQLSQRLNYFGNQDEIEPIYFSMDWEILSQSRLAYQYGWNKLSYSLDGLFAHAVTIELINYITIDGRKLGDYVDAKEKYSQLQEDEKEELIKKIEELSSFYTNHITVLDAGANWDKCEKEISEFLENNSYRYPEEISIKLISLYKRVKYQFDNSSRKSALDKYGNWLYTFCKSNYTKTRGRLGSTTVLNQDLLLFLTKLCVGNEDKIRLNQLWEKLEQRGLIFDEVSKTEIIKLYERINLLEKKSDSGDAQYIKTII
jgi:DNA phosphorothioation-dependent restriction protein DptG